MRTFFLLFTACLLLSCDRKYYGGMIAVGEHNWQLKKIDTFYFDGLFRPSAIWYNTFNRLTYVDNDHEFPYPYHVGVQISNFDTK